MEQIISMDDQPISAMFFREGRWLTSFVTPSALEVQNLYNAIALDIDEPEEKIIACHQWVASKLKYKQFIRGKLQIEGKVSTQEDLWNQPSTTIKVGVGNCSNKAFLLCSLLRNELPADKVHVVLGNLYNGKPGGHAWVQVKLNGDGYIVESTRADAPTLISARAAERYEAVHFFNDQELYAIEGRTVLEPFTACYSTWLRDYLDWVYVEGGGRK